MSPKGVKRIQSGADGDIISNLPQDVIAHILGEMPIREAVRTSILSKKWRFFYLYIQKLVFDDQFCRELEGFFVKEGTFSFMLQFYRFDEIVTKSLLLHPGEIESFRVCIPYDTSLVRPVVNKWILYLSWRKIKRLTLTREFVTPRHKLPPYFFSCLDVTYLKLQKFVLSAPLAFKGFLNLYNLLLNRVEFTNNCFERVISSCPVLKTLSLHHCFGIHHFNISGSNLERLFIKDDEKFKSISLENASNLSEVSVSLEIVVTGTPVTDLVTFVSTMPKVKILRLSGIFLQLLDETPVLPMLSPSSYSLKILELKGVNFMDLNQISAAVRLIRSAPNLQELYVEASTIELNQELVLGYLKRLDCTAFPLSKLHLVKLTNISAIIPEFEFIRFILFSSPSLVTMYILQHPQLEAEKALNIARKLLQLRPPSAVSIDF